MITSTPKDHCVNYKCVFEPNILVIERSAHSCTYMVTLQTPCHLAHNHGKSTKLETVMRATSLRQTFRDVGGLENVHVHLAT